MTQRIAVPRDTADLSAYIDDFTATHGLPPMMGGETAVADPGQQQATPPAAAPTATPAPAVPPAAGGIANADVMPATGQQTQQGAPDTGQQAPAATQPPDWAQTLLERMEEIAPPQAADPLAAELFGYPEAAQAPGQAQQPQGLPQLTPEQLAQAQALGLVPQGGAPGLLGQQPPVMPGMQPQPGVPGFPGAQGRMQNPELEAVRQLIRDEALAVARAEIRSEVQPYMQTQDQQRRRQEAIAMTEEYPEFRDKAYASDLVTRARQWATQLFGKPEYAGEPGFLELVHLAGKQLQVARQEGGAAGQPGSGAEVPIEQPGGANPGASTTDIDQIGQRIVAASPKQGLSPLWT